MAVEDQYSDRIALLGPRFTPCTPCALAERTGRSARRHDQNIPNFQQVQIRGKELMNALPEFIRSAFEKTAGESMKTRNFSHAICPLFFPMTRPNPTDMIPAEE